MESFFALFVKLSVIFCGGGLAALFATWVAREASTIPKLVIERSKDNLKNKNVELIKCSKVSSHSGFYEISLLNSKEKEKIQIFSFHKGMKRLN